MEGERVQAVEPSVWTPEPLPGEKCLDLCFVLDCTGSMGSYIDSATQNIDNIVNEIVNSEKLSSPACLRLALVAFRDHPPQDHTYITKVFNFTSDVTEIKGALKSLYASGGGDGPEAVTAALADTLNLPWRQQATKMCVLIADCPPHGIQEYGDGFPEGSPCGNDPLQLARTMASVGITLFMVACEPALSGYTWSTDFYRALCHITSGTMLPLTSASLLAHVIVGSTLEQMDLERLLQEVGPAVAQRLASGDQTVDDIARDLHTSLSLRNEAVKHLVVENIYRDIPDANHNVQVWCQSQNIIEARPHLKKVTTSRFNDEYNAKRSSSYRSYYRPPVPPRPSPESPPRTSPASPSSPPRRVLSDFKPFSAGSDISIAGTSMAGTPAPAFGSKPSSPSAPASSTFSGSSSLSAFGLRSGATPGAVDPEKTDVSNEALSGVELKLAGISFEQARKLTMMTAWQARA